MSCDQPLAPGCHIHHDTACSAAAFAHRRMRRMDILFRNRPGCVHAVRLMDQHEWIYVRVALLQLPDFTLIAGTALIDREKNSGSFGAS